MKWFRNASIKTKLRLLFGVGCGLILLAGCAVFVCHDFQMIRSHSSRQSSVLADTLGANSVTALLFDDPDVGNEVLSSLRLEPSVLAAATYDSSHKLFSTYRRSDTSFVLSDKTTFDEDRLLSNGYATLRRPIMHNEQRVGQIVLVTSTSALYRQLVDYAIIASVIFLVGMGAVFGLSSVFQRVIAEPILQLVEAMRQVSTFQDYDQRVEVMANDEVGALCSGYNHMIDQIADRDIQLREAMQQVEKAQRKAEAANHSKSRFLANMSHEIRTPLTGILGFTEILLKGSVTDPATQREHLQTVHTSGRHLLNLINDILDLSKIEADQMQIERIECEPHPILEEVVSLLRARAMKKGIELDYTWSSKVPARVLTDPDRLRQLLMNIVGNAVKFTESGGVQIVARTDGPVEQASLVIEVVDSGIGISPENLNKIFDPFVQADNSVTRRFGGTGLGLAISRRLARALGGELHVESQPGHGTTFTITVDPGPLKDVQFLDAPAADALSTKKQIEKSDVCVTLPPSRILLVEDGPTNRKLFKAILEEAGANVTTAENGQVGVELASKKRFDMVLMDMQMPVMDGYSAATRMRELGMDIPIIALTAHAMKKDEDKCKSAGCSGFLTKPIKSEHLLEAVANSLAPCDLPTDKASSHTTKFNAADSITTAEESMIVSTLPIDKSIFREIVIEFSQFLCDQLDDMRTVYSEGQFEELAKLAHSLKGAGGSAGFDVLTEPAKRLQHWSEQEHSENIDGILTELSDLSNRISQGVSAMRETDAVEA